MESNSIRLDSDIAVIGMSCRVPGADNIYEFWNNIANGIESITFFTDEDLLVNGVDPELLKNKNYIKAKGHLKNIDMFDADFFHYNPSEARVMDPQIRIFHECVWEALEDAGYMPSEYEGLIGLYAGASPNVPWEIMTFLEKSEDSIDVFTTGMKNNKDLLSTLVSYNLNLKGPSITLFTACSTSMIAIHKACQGLLSGDCDIALAGGVSIELPDKAGYLYQEGMIKSRDGHCRAFDGDASGTIYGNGAGVVVLKRLEEAIADHDHIDAIIRGTAINNDGKRKVGYTAPSVEGQAEVIKVAHQIADIKPEELSYVETHGTGTALGDPIEIEGLITAFESEQKSFCAIGSVKPNIGHLDAAAGVSSFIKAVMAIKNKKIPPHIHYTHPNLKIDFINSPFYVNQELLDWETKGHPRLAGVSSFGLGGTNCHIVLQEMPKQQIVNQGRDYQLLMLSARSEEALDRMCIKFAEFFNQSSNELADIAYTLHIGREHFKYRKAIVCKNKQEAVRLLEEKSETRRNSKIVLDRDIYFLFTDIKQWNSEMVKELYRQEEFFRNRVNSYLELVRKTTGKDISVNAPIVQEDRTYSSIILQCAIYDLFKEWGINPKGIAAYGNGEFAAACAVGLLTPEEVFLIMSNQYSDADRKEKSVITTVMPCIFGSYHNKFSMRFEPSLLIKQMGKSSEDSIRSNQELFRKETSLYVSVAGLNTEFHQDRQIPLLQSNRVGEGTQASFYQCLALLWEFGAKFNGNRYYANEKRMRVSMPTYAFEHKSYWVDEGPYRKLLGNQNNNALFPTKELSLYKLDQKKWFYKPKWNQINLQDIAAADEKKAVWLVFNDGSNAARSITRDLNKDGQRVVTVGIGTDYQKVNNYEYLIDPNKQEQYLDLMREMTGDGLRPRYIFHLWNVIGAKEEQHYLIYGYYSLLYLSKAIIDNQIFSRINLAYITRETQKVLETDEVIPEKILGVSVCKVLLQENSNISCTCIDIETVGEQGADSYHYLRKEICLKTNGNVIAYRNHQRYELHYETIDYDIVQACLSKNSIRRIPDLKEEGVYIITGGLGDIGLTFAKSLAHSVPAKIVLIGRSGMPEKENWNNLLENENLDLKIKDRIVRIQEIEAMGAEITVIQADVADKNKMKEVFQWVLGNYGSVNGIIHAAGIVRVKSGQTPIERISKEDSEEQFRPKILGTRVLDEILREIKVDFVLLISSLAPVLGGLGHVAYAAANAFMDSFAERNSKESNHWISVNWSEWVYTGDSYHKYSVGDTQAGLALTKEEGMKTFQAVLSLVENKRLVISTGDLNKRLFQWLRSISQGEEDEIISIHTDTFNIFNSSQPEIQKLITEIWCNFYATEKVGIQDNFFDLGATSLDFIHLHSKISRRVKRNFPLETMFEYPTIEQLASYLSAGVKEAEMVSAAVKIPERKYSGKIAVIGMAGRFPGARNLDEYWDNLKNGVSSIRFFTDEELDEAGIDSQTYQNPDYVKAKGYLERADYFDAEFFHYSEKDAEMMDPQMRLFHEYVWGALEDAGYNADTYEGSIGLYGGATPNLYWEVMAQMSQTYDSASQFDAALLYDKDSLTTQISYKLNLKGPSVTLFTGCSTSLVAIDSACQGILAGQCNMAVAGGVTVTLPIKTGYMYQPGMILSPDGKMNSLDAEANGLVYGDGVGAVVLKRLEDAIAERDHIYAVIRGSAVNNDGNRKVGYTSPSIKGQAEVIRTAQMMAGIEPQDLSYIEAHGTATPMGDVIEFQGLIQAFHKDKKQYCYLGTMKPNTGHLMCASGVAGFIKTVFILKNRLIPPCINFQEPNAEFELENSPFYINQKPVSLKNKKGPLIAGVSSMGIGGTNAHVILEEASELMSSTRKRHWKMLLLSARSLQELDAETEDLVTYMVNNPQIRLSDISYTLQVGRKLHRFRRTLIAEEQEDAIILLKQRKQGRVRTKEIRNNKKALVFLFSGQGAQYVNMGKELYQMEPIYREEVDRCTNILKLTLGYSVLELLYPANQNDEENRKAFNHIKNTQLIVFIFEYALTKLLLKWGLKPSAVMGYSFGEYVAALFAGVFSLEDALKIIALRGELMSTLSEGAMLSVPLPEVELRLLLDEFNSVNKEINEVSLGIVNGMSCICSGEKKAMEKFTYYLKEKRIMSIPVSISHGVHSKEMEPIALKLENYIAQIKLNHPKLPYISGVTGTWITDEQAMDPGYWSRHLVNTIYFSDGITELLKEENSIFIEIGPGRELIALMQRFLGKETERIINIVPPQESKDSNSFYLLTKLAHLWSQGIKIDWKGFYADEERKRISLPQYPFNGKRYRLEGNPMNMVISQINVQKKDTREWLYVPQWIHSENKSEEDGGEKQIYLVFDDKQGTTKEITAALNEVGWQAIHIYYGSGFTVLNRFTYTLRPGVYEDMQLLCSALKAEQLAPDKIIHGFGITGLGSCHLDRQYFTEIQELLYYDVLNLAKLLAENFPEKKMVINILTDRMAEVTGEEEIDPAKATVMGAALVIPQEYENLRTRCIDLAPTNYELIQKNKLIHELLTKPYHNIVALRGKKRWIKKYDRLCGLPAMAGEAVLRNGGVYIITGGLGGIGFIISKYLAANYHAKLILTGRTKLPPQKEQDEWLSGSKKDNPASEKIRRIKILEDRGANVKYYSADVSDENRMSKLFSEAEAAWEQIHGVIHCAGLLEGESFNIIRAGRLSEFNQQFDSKVYGVMVLEKLLRGRKADFCLLMSSVSSVLGGLGFAGYSAGNVFMDSFASCMGSREGTRWLSVGWSEWKYEKKVTMQLGESLSEYAMNEREATEEFEKALNSGLSGQLVNSPGSLEERLQTWVYNEVQKSEEEVKEDDTEHYHDRPAGLSAEYVKPGNQTEEAIADIWKSIFRVRDIGIHDDFIELGGDSLKAITVVSRIHKILNVEIPVVEFFQNLTVEKLACYISNSGKSDYRTIVPVKKKSCYPVSAAQKRVYIIRQMEGEQTSYNTPVAVILHGELNCFRLAACFQDLIKRHETLRTSFRFINGELMQNVEDKVSFQLIQSDLSESETGKDDVSLKALVHEFIKPFELDKAPLLRAELVKLEEKKYMLMYDLHHIISDGVSANLVVEDLIALYTGRELKELKLQYRDFSEWQNQLFRSGDLKRQEVYWLNKLSGNITALNLPTDFIRPEARSFEGDTVFFEIDKDVTAQLNQLAAETKSTLYIVLLAGYNILLSKITGQTDISVGLSTAGRYNPDLQDIIGMFVNTVVLLNHPSGDKNFLDFLYEVKQTAYEAYENQDYPFDDLVEALKLEREAGRSPLFDTMFTLQNLEVGEVEMDKLRVTPFEFETTIAKFDLNMNAWENEGKIQFIMEYAVALFKRESVINLTKRYMRILKEIIEDKNKLIYRIEEGIEQKNVMLNNFNDDLELE